MNHPQTTAYRYGAYARKSSENEDRQVQSIPRQNDEMNEVIARDGLSLCGEIIEETMSAFAPGRPGFSHLVKLTFQKKVNAWLCWHVNRLSRNPIDAGIIVDLMDQGLLDHIRTPSRVYHNNPTDKMMLQIEFTMSKKDSDDKSEFVKSGLKKRYSKGLPTGRACIGFLNDRTKEKGDRDWLVDHERLEKVRLLLRRYLKGNDSIRTLTRYARQELRLTTVPAKNTGGALVSQSRVEAILKNPVYAGFFYSLDENGRGHTRRELDSRLPRLLAEPEHYRILQMLAGKNKPKRAKHISIYAPFMLGADGGTIGGDHKFQLICDCKRKFSYRDKDRCPDCERLISDMEHPKYLSYVYYYNVSRSREQGVQAKCIEEKKIDALLSEFITDNLLLSEAMHHWALKHLEFLEQQDLKEIQLVSDTGRKEREQVDRRLERLRQMYLDELISDEEFRSEKQKFTAQKAELSATDQPFLEPKADLKDVLATFQNAGEIIRSGSYDSKTDLLHKLSSNLVWDEENLRIIRPDWLTELMEVRILMMAEIELFEPAKQPKNKRPQALFEHLSPALLRQWDVVRTLYQEAKNLSTAKSARGKSVVPLSKNQDLILRMAA